MFDFEIKELNKRKNEKISIKNTKSFNWKFKIIWIQNTIKFVSNLLFFQFDFLLCKKSTFLYKSNLSCDHHLFQYIVDEKYVKFISWIVQKYEFFLIQHYVSFTMFQKLIILLFLYDISIWRIKNKLNNKKRILKVLCDVKIKSFEKISKIIRIRLFIIRNIEIKITNIFKSIVIE